jgi:predicted amino acid dehydrogenase
VTAGLPECSGTWSTDPMAMPSPKPFAFIIHPIDVRRDVARRYPAMGLLPVRAIEWIIKHKSPMPVATVSGIRSSTGAETRGWLIGCPLTPRQFMELPVEFVYRKLEECGRIAEGLGAGIVGLGAFTSVVGDGGITLAERLTIAVTTGNSYTVWTALEGATRAARLMGVDPASATGAVVGATGSIGATSASILARRLRRLCLVGRDRRRLDELAERLGPTSSAELNVSTDVPSGLHDADLVVAVSSAADAIIEPNHLKRGCVVCDVARPRDVSVRVARERDDVLVIEGGVVQVPGRMECSRYEGGGPFSFGFPPGTAYACMSETMALSLEKRYESFTLGKTVSVEQVDGIGRICDRHGFALAGFRSFERAVDDGEIEHIRRRAGR